MFMKIEELFNPYTTEKPMTLNFTTSGQQQYPEIRSIAKNVHIKHYLVVICAEAVKYATYTVAKRKPDFNS